MKLLAIILSLSIACNTKFHLENRLPTPTNIDSLTTIVEETSKLIPRKILGLVIPKTKIVLVDSLVSQPEFERYRRENTFGIIYPSFNINRKVCISWGTDSDKDVFNPQGNLDERYTLGMYVREDYLEYCLSHEIGHISSRVIGDLLFGGYLHKTEEFQEAFSSDEQQIKKRISRYYSIRIEWYAQSFKLFYNPKTREYLRKNFPATYEFHEDIEARLD